MQDISVYFRALGDRKRLGILQYLAGHEQVPVTELGEKLRLSQPLISWHLRVLRRAGVVKTRRTGRQVLCSLNRQALRKYRTASTKFLVSRIVMCDLPVKGSSRAWNRCRTVSNKLGRGEQPWRKFEWGSSE